MPGHVEQSELELANLRVACKIVLCRNNLVYEFGRDVLACLIMLCECIEVFRLKSPIFHNL